VVSADEVADGVARMKANTNYEHAGLSTNHFKLCVLNYIYAHGEAVLRHACARQCT